ncbi:DUF1622 domain-containing protein [Mycobacterium marinum]|uniref:DUF1622 domain-containing protein n=1 Tax=Mycobacterium marinum TaxID=1781 RepID=UPI000358E45B|nr:DUF1622 domain-containing protein [Mycobacterium marinum]EPQ75327.1 hypothetical protein MMEU_2987 [Mycobacterium marinum str. Europe]WOR02671.1 DUF1622 domain-containing protein [Mycobacterium marinum]BBC66549.1 hypothetical protein MMRN_34450 [Mycobacterium marinum]CDM77328.1 conserved hypothetical membrane protein [Mycobacterium marinum E11]
MSFIETVSRIGMAIDGMGVAVIMLGAVVSSGLFVAHLPRRPDRAYREFRQNLGRSILIGLELLVAGDIINTILVTPNGESVAALAGVVAIRTFLSISLTVEMTGRWPWRQPTVSPETTAAGGQFDAAADS